MSNDAYMIYHLKDDTARRPYHFEPFGHLEKKGLAVERGNYTHMYTGPLGTDSSDGDKLFKLKVLFNTDPPKDYTGRGLTVSDIVVLCREEHLTAYYVDEASFVNVPEFLDAPYKYYSTQRPIDIGTYPKTENGPNNLINYEICHPVEGGIFRAWGELEYSDPLTQKQMDYHELRAAPGNPDFIRAAPAQLEAQAQVVGRWEESKRIPEVRRLTWWYPDFGAYVKNELATDAQLSERYEKIAARQRDRRPTIKDQLLQGAGQAEKENTSPAAATRSTDRSR